MYNIIIIHILIGIDASKGANKTLFTVNVISHLCSAHSYKVRVCKLARVYVWRADHHRCSGLEPMTLWSQSTNPNHYNTPSGYYETFNLKLLIWYAIRPGVPGNSVTKHCGILWCDRVSAVETEFCSKEITLQQRTELSIKKKPEWTSCIVDAV